MRLISSICLYLMICISTVYFPVVASFLWDSLSSDLVFVSKHVLVLSYRISKGCFYILSLGGEYDVTMQIATFIQQVLGWVVYTSNVSPIGPLCFGLVVVTSNLSSLLPIITASSSNRNYSSVVAIYVGNLQTKWKMGLDETLVVLLIAKYESNDILVTNLRNSRLLAHYKSKSNDLILDKSAPPSPWLNGLSKAHMWIGNIIPTKILNLRRSGVHVSLFECPPFVIYPQATNFKNESVFSLSGIDGIEVRIIQAIMHDYPIVFMLKDQYNNVTDTWGDVFKDVLHKRADIGICSLWMALRKMKFMDMSQPWTKQYLSFLVPKPKKIPLARAVYLCLEPTTWYALICSWAISTAVLWITAKLIPTQVLSKVDMLYLKGRYCLLSISRILSMNPAPFLPDHISLRIILTSWSVFSVLVTTCYSTGFMSLLASSPYSKTLDTFKDLLEAGIFWGEKYNFIQRNINETGNSNLIAFDRRFQEEKFPEDRENRIRGGKYAIFVKVLNHYVSGSEDIDPLLRQLLRVMKEPLFTFYVCFALQKVSPIKSYIDYGIERLFHGGLIQYWVDDVIRKLGHRYMQNLFFGNVLISNSHEPLTMTSLQGAFIVLLIGLCLSNFVLVLEVVIYFTLRINITEKYTWCLLRNK